MKIIPLNYEINSDPLTDVNTDCLVLGVFTNGLSENAKAVDARLNNMIQSLQDSGSFKGTASELLPIFNITGIGAKAVVLIGLGDKEKLTRTILKKATQTVTKWAISTKITNLTFALIDECPKKEMAIHALIEAVGTASYRFSEFKSEKPEALHLETVYIHVKNETDSLKAAVSYGAALTKGMNLTRDLGNHPGNSIYPETLSEAAEHLAKEYRHVLSCKVLNDADMLKLGMGALMAVAQGSVRAPNMIVLHYHNAESKEEKPIVFVGKGVTFDSGGISLKPGAAMDEMKYDMCGAASVLGSFKAMAELELPINAIGIIPAVENMPSGSAVKPGDIVTSMSGQTIEILNTDAEGRLILCDALTYAEQFNPEVVVDIATLTGAIIVALGNIPTGLFANDETVSDRIKKCAEATNDYVWPLPIWEEYQSQLDSNFADIANISSGRGGGSITAACFLSRFTKKYPWAHLDIAGTAWDSGPSKGATGRPVPLLLEFLKSYGSL